MYVLGGVRSPVGGAGFSPSFFFAFHCFSFNPASNNRHTVYREGCYSSVIIVLELICCSSSLLEI